MTSEVSPRRPAEDAVMTPGDVADALGLKTEELARLIRVHHNTLKLHPETSSVRSGMATLTHVMRLLGKVQSDPGLAAFHFKNTPVRVLGGRTMLEAMLAGDNEKVARYLQMASGGQNG